MPESQAPRRPRLLGAAAKRRICERLAAGETLTRICRDPTLPAKPAVLRALCRDEDFRAAYRRAKTLQAEQWAEEILEIADGGPLEEAESGEKADLQRAKLRVEARKWLLARLAGRDPEAAGETPANDLDDPPEIDFSALDDSERAALREILARRAGGPAGRAEGA